MLACEKCRNTIFQAYIVEDISVILECLVCKHVGTIQYGDYDA